MTGGSAKIISAVKVPMSSDVVTVTAVSQLPVHGILRQVDYAERRLEQKAGEHARRDDPFCAVLRRREVAHVNCSSGQFALPADDVVVNTNCQGK